MKSTRRATSDASARSLDRRRGRHGGEGVEHAVVGVLARVVAVEQDWLAAAAALTLRVAPGVRVADAPDGERGARRLSQARLGDAGEAIALPLASRLDVAAHHAATHRDVELGDVDLEA